MLNQSLGVVGDRIVTQRAVQASRGIDSLWSGVKAMQADLTSQDVTAVLVEKVVALEAAGFDFGGVPKDRLQRELERVKTHFNSNSKLKALGFSEKELETLVLEKLTFKAFIEFKTNSLKSVISDSEAKLYFEKNRYKFGNVEFESYRGQVVSFLEQQQLQERLRSWFEILKRKYRVRNLVVEGDKK